MIIKTTEDLNFYVNKINGASYIAIDTEFLREKTYWPQLCLIQIATDEVAFCVDTLAEGIDLSPLFKLLENKNITKVFHAARQDIEIFFNLTGKIPAPIFDTQIAAMVCGVGDCVSYKDLVTSLLGVTIDKGMRYTDWSKRPLDDRQIAYALTDVTYLRDIFKILSQRLKENNRASWINEEMNVLTNINTYKTDPYEAFLKLKTGGLKPHSLSVLRELAAWRENTAKNINVPKTFIIKDNILHELALFNPKSVEDLSHVRGFSASNKFASEIYHAIKLGLDNSVKIKLPHKPKAPKSLLDIFKLLLHIKAEELGIASKIIASSDELEKLAVGEVNINSMTGWRYEVFGKFAVSLKNGNIALLFNPQTNKIEIIEADNP